MVKFKYVTVKPDLSVVVTDKREKFSSSHHYPEFRVQFVSPDYEVTVMTNIPSQMKDSKHNPFKAGPNDGWEFFGAEEVVMPVVNGFLAGKPLQLADLGAYLTGLGYRSCCSGSTY